MTSKRSRSVSTIRNDQIKKFDACQICGDKARIINYGALSCPSCKTFFRRHGFRLEDIPVCFYQGNCSIAIATRKSCAACRFAKCLAMGMSRELIRKEDLHGKNRSSNKFTREMVSKKPVPVLLNLLFDDQSSRTSINWRLLSNVIHAFDTYSPVLNIQKAVYLISINSEQIQPNVENSLYIIGFIYAALQSFVNCTADFRVLTTAEQCSLLRRNMYGLLTFYCIFVFRESGVFDNTNTENVILPLYGYKNVQSTKRMAIRLEHDSTLVKLMLIILTFSSNYFQISDKDRAIKDGLLNGTFRLLGSQNIYVGLLWNYMTYRYSFRDAVRRFNGMINIALDALKLASDIYHSNKIHRDFMDNIAEQYEHFLNLNGLEEAPLWGKD